MAHGHPDSHTYYHGADRPALGPSGFEIALFRGRKDVKEHGETGCPTGCLMLANDVAEARA